METVTKKTGPVTLTLSAEEAEHVKDAIHEQIQCIRTWDPDLDLEAEKATDALRAVLQRLADLGLEDGE
jgi:hypothetical protein